MKSLFKKLFSNFEEIISSFFICITVFVVIMNVILRYGFNRGLVWSEEVATISFVWSVFIGASAGFKRRMHIGIDMLVKLLPAKIQGFFNLIVGIMLITLNGYIFYLSTIFIKASAIKPTPVLGISSAYVSAAILIGFGLMTMHSIVFFVKDLYSFINSFRTEKKIESV